MRIVITCAACDATIDSAPFDGPHTADPKRAHKNALREGWQYIMLEYGADTICEYRCPDHQVWSAAAEKEGTIEEGHVKLTDQHREVLRLLTNGRYQ